MQSACPQRLPFKSYLYRVVGENRFLLIVTLIEANTLTIPDIYRRDYLYGKLPLPATNFLALLSIYHITISIVITIFSLRLFLDRAGADC